MQSYGMNLNTVLETCYDEMQNFSKLKAYASVIFLSNRYLPKYNVVLCIKDLVLGNMGKC